MALTDEGSGLNVSMPVAPAYGMPYGAGGYGNNGFGFGGDMSWIILLLLVCGGGWGGFGGFGGMGGFGGAMWDFPWLLNGQNQINANTNAGFDHAATQAAIGDLSNAVTSGFGNVQTSLCGGFAGVNATVNGAQNAISQQLYTNQISDLERSFAAQTANTQGLTALQAQLAQCCCDNRAATQDVKYTIATEACATRAANTQNTQAILDKLCQLELDNYKTQVEAKNDTINQLRSQLQFVNMQASQVDQTAQLRANQATVANQLVSELRSCPIPSYSVYGNQPVFTCAGPTVGNNNGCGCGNNFNGFAA